MLVPRETVFLAARGGPCGESRLSLPSEFERTDLCSKQKQAFC